VEFDILYNEGISKSGDLIDLAVNAGMVKKSGAWFTYGEDRFQGREQFRQKLIELPEIYESLRKEVRVKLGMVKGGKEEKNDKADEKSGGKEKKSSK
jgi:recombination protein RecA